MKARNILLIIVLMLLSAACRTDGGDIGVLYGQWLMRSYTIDGEEADIELTNYNWRFQGNIICITQILPFHDFIENMGTWSRDGDVLSLNFTHSTSDDETGDIDTYSPPAELGIPAHAITDMDINELTDKSMQLSFTDESGQLKVYRFEKLK